MATSGCSLEEFLCYTFSQDGIWVRNTDKMKIFSALCTLHTQGPEPVPVINTLCLGLHGWSGWSEANASGCLPASVSSEGSWEEIGRRRKVKRGLLDSWSPQDSRLDKQICLFLARKLKPLQTGMPVSMLQWIFVIVTNAIMVSGFLYTSTSKSLKIIRIDLG